MILQGNRIGWAVAVFVTFACAFLPESSGAASIVLDDLILSETPSEWEVRILFGVPVRYLRHAPPHEGADVEVTVEVLGGLDVVDVLAGGPEVLRPASRSPIPLEEVRLALLAGGGPQLLIRFDQSVAYRIESGADFRSLSIFVEKKAATVGPPVAVTGRVARGSPDEIMEEARRAMVAHQYDRAIALYTLVLDSSRNATEDQTREALEYLGLARQKNGQTAHARAEYERYLDLFPNGEGSDRVRQRLAAIATAGGVAPEKLQGAASREPTRFDYHGSLYTTYFRTESFADLSGAELTDSSQLFNTDVTARLRRGDLELRGRGTGYVRLNYDDWDADPPSRITRLYLEGRDRAHGLEAVVGRQSSPGGGVLGRLDGVTASWSFLPTWSINAVAGFPKLYSVSNAIETNHQVYGASVETSKLFDGLSAELYGVTQFADGVLDRAAVGIEARYVDARRSAFGLIDFDVHFGELNIAMLSGSWRVTDSTTLNGVVDYRYSPYLTTRNALLGQPSGDLDDLEGIFSDSEIEDLAKDRTPRVTTLVAGASHRFSETLEVYGDFTASQIGKTKSSGGVPGYGSGDWFFNYSAQLVSWNCLMDGGSERLRLRIFDGDYYDSYAVILSGRYPLAYHVRITPAIRFDYRVNQNTQDFLELSPGIRIEYQLFGVVLDANMALEWIEGVGGGPSPRNEQLGYILSLGARYDF